ncbi:MAG TPA: DNA polymerase III subunit gamma/tau [Bacillales bacterium]|nr:DNA polymerase III subunit gamma/tau [Bacillales bacterium]
MSYQALYRVWRPQTFADVIGQEHITKTLQNALLKEKSSHAYLFTGPRGTGKTSAAKIIAKAVNCEKAPTAEPCNECSACRGITDGSISDVIEIDAASNNGVDEIRDIRDRVKYAPSAVRYKVYIIDEVHMLSQGAFNALLKTLEEPPEHVLFILATTEPHKIPLTIISRCQRFDFRPIAGSAIVERLKRIIDANESEADEEALKLVAQASEGGMRDALSLLDQVLSFGDGEISIEDVLAVTGSVSREFLADVTQAVAERDASRGIQAIGSLIEKGKDPVRFLQDLIFYYRDLLLYQTSSGLESVLERAKVDDHFRHLVETVEKPDIYRIIETLNASQQEMKWTNHPRIFLELSIVKLCQPDSGSQKAEPQPREAAERPQPDSSLVERIQKLEGELRQLKKQGVPASQTEASAPKEKRRPAGGSSRGVKVETARIKHLLDEASKQALQQLKGQWGDIMEKIRKQKISAHACLIESQPVACSDKSFLLAFKYDIHCQMINEEKHRQVVEQIVAEACGHPMEMLTVPSAEWEKLKTAYIQKQRGESEENGKDEEDPLVAEAKKLFGSDLIEIKK